MVGRRGMGIVGVAATAKVVSNRAQAKAEEQREAEAGAQPSTLSAPAGGDDMVAQLQKLADLKAAGVLSNEELAAAKEKVLAGLLSRCC